MSASALPYTLASDIQPLPTFSVQESSMKLLRKSLARNIRFRLGTYRGGIDICKRCAGIRRKGLFARTIYYETTYYELEHDLRDLSAARCKSCRLLARWRSEVSDLALDSLRLDWAHPHQKARKRRYRQLHADFITLPLRDKFICRVTSSHVNPIPPALVVSRMTSSEAASAFSHLYPKYVDIKQIKRWIHACETRHHACRLTESCSNIIHLKVIDCELGIVVPAPHQCRYVALSYVWGQQDTDLREEEPNAWEDLPNLIDDALHLTQQVGYRYLWVDRYCIDQENAQHKHTQIAQMGDIYAMAAVTIVAAAGNNPAHGLPGLSFRPRRPVRHSKMGDLLISLLPTKAGENFVQSTWASRAWTFQEGFLSRRRLIFTDTHISFVCNTNFHHETKNPAGSELFGNMWLRGWQPRMLFGWKDQHFENALACLGAYSARTLSYDHDALNAITGVLNTLATHSIGHLWGVPLQHPLKALEPDQGTGSRFAIIWQHSTPCHRRPGFPSWSPLGWDGQAKWNLSLYSVYDTHTFAILIGNEVHSLAEHPLDIPTDHALISQCLRINAEIADLRLVGHDPIGTSSEACIVLPVNGEVNVLLKPMWDKPILQQDAIIPGILLTVTLKYRICHFILLLHKHDEHYERVGIAEIYPSPIETKFGEWAPRFRDNDLRPFNGYNQDRSVSANEWRSALPAIDPRLLFNDLWLRQHFRKESILLG